MAASVAAPGHPHPHFPRGLNISDLDLRDDRYPRISSSRHVPPGPHQGTKTANLVSSHSHILPDAMHQPVRGPSLPSPDLATPSFTLASAQPDIPQVSDERRSMLQPDAQPSQASPPIASFPPNSNPVDHARAANSPPSMNEINSRLYGPSRISQASIGEVSKPGDVPSPTLHPSSLQPGSPRQASLRVSRPTDQYIPSRSGAAPSQGQGVELSSLSPSMRFSQYNPAITVSSNPRVQAHQPTYINPAPAPTPINPVFTSQPLPAEEICVECAMRDQDMADVDVTSPGVWSRESDVHYDELLRRELEEEAMAISPQEQQRPRARGGRLMEANLKLWLTMNPKEPASKGEALEKYVTAQQALVEAEALAHARAMLESRQLEDRMRDAYSQLRRSAYELGAATSQDDRGIRIKTLRSSVPHLPGQTNGQSREVTVLENGMLVEHVDFRKEEREGRQQRRREEKRTRPRKSSRGSAFDVASMYSTTSPLPQTDSGLPLLPSHSSTSRPMSVLTSPDTLVTRGMQSNASVEALSMISAGASPRLTRFFGARNLSPSFRSSDSLAGASGMSGSMVDMHLALQPERLHSPVELGDRLRTIDSWRDSSALNPSRGNEQKSEDKQKKRKSLAKIWRLVTGSPKNTSAPVPNLSQTRSLDRAHDDDYPLAPPPPLSYLVSRGTGDNASSALRHVSTPSLPSSVSPNYPLSSAGMSPPTAPSSSLPSPTSSRPLVTSELSENRKGTLVDSDGEQLPSPVPEEDSLQASGTQRSVYPTTSEPDLRRRLSQALSGLVPPVPPIPTSVTQTMRPPSLLGWRDKTLPPLPGETQSRTPTVAQGEMRPHTLFSYDMREVNDGQVLVAPRPPFAQEERRRQSFNGLGNSRPSLAVQSLPARRNGFDPEKYGMFGGSRNALVPASKQQPTKRKSRFSFASLFGRKNSVPMQGSEPVEFSLGRSSGSDARHEAELGMQYGNLMAEAEAGQGHTFPRLSMSLTPRKNIESLVDQSPDFVAYRYPSVDRNLHLLQ